MRSSTIFFVFIGILVAVFLFAALSKVSTASQPAVKTASKFIDAVKAEDAGAVKALVDQKTAAVAYAGNKLTGIRFKEVSAFTGAFTKRPSVLWNYMELEHMQLDLSLEPQIVPDEGLASISLTSGGRIYLRKVDGAWKVAYIGKPEDEKKTE